MLPSRSLSPPTRCLRSHSTLSYNGLFGEPTERVNALKKVAGSLLPCRGTEKSYREVLISTSAFVNAKRREANRAENATLVVPNPVPELRELLSRRGSHECTSLCVAQQQ